MFRWPGAPWRAPDQAAMAAPHPQAGSPEPEPAVLALQSSKLRPEVRDAALSIWHSTRAAMEGAPPEQLYPAYLAALRAQKRGGPARAVAAALAQAFPAALWPKVELAALLHRSGDHQRALEIGQAITAAFPDAPDGPRVVLQALVALGRREAAENLLATLPPALQEQEWVLQARLQTARRSGHAHAEADAQAAIAARLRQIAPSNPLGHSWAIAAARDAGQLDQAETLAQAAIQASPDSADVWRQAALVAQARKQEELAYQRWETLRTRFPKSPAGFIGAVELSLALQQPAVTESLLGPALEKFPNNRDLLTAAARLAVRGRKWAEAAVRWQEVIDRSPDDPAVALAAAMSFIGPQAGRQKRLPAVLRRLEAIHERFPDFVPAYAAHINALREAKRSEEAEALGAQWAARFPADPTLAIARARIAEDLGRPADALAWLEAARAAGKPTPPLEAATIRALSLAGRPDQAEQACRQALEKFADSVAILIEFVDLATRAGDWREALDRAELAIRRRPDDERIRALLRRARAQILDGSVTDGAPPPVAGAAVTEEIDTAEFFKRFESLGATSAGCEFGLVQRRFGAEPFGLMRWAKIRVEGLIEALLTRFEGMGLEENTQLIVQRASADHSEYYVQDSRFGYWTHTFVKEQDAPFDRMYKQSVRRVQFLRNKLLEDLAAGDKIYTFKWTRDVDPALLRQVFAALKTYGEDCTLLCVTLADAAHPKGTLEMLENGLFVGRTNSFMDAGVHGEIGVDTAQWRALCEQVAAWHASRAPAAAR